MKYLLFALVLGTTLYAEEQPIIIIENKIVIENKQIVQRRYDDFSYQRKDSYKDDADNFGEYYRELRYILNGGKAESTN